MCWAACCTCTRVYYMSLHFSVVKDKYSISCFHLWILLQYTLRLELHTLFPFRGLYAPEHTHTHTHQTQGQNLTASTQLPTLCCPNSPGLGGNVFAYKISINELSSESPDLAPAMKGAWQVKGHHRHLRGRRTWPSTHHPSWLQASSVTSGQNSHS